MSIPRSLYPVIGANLSVARQSLDLTIDEVARRMQLSTAIIEAVERGDLRPSPMELRIWCRMVRLPIHAVFQKPALP